MNIADLRGNIWEPDVVKKESLRWYPSLFLSFLYRPLFLFHPLVSLTSSRSSMQTELGPETLEKQRKFSKSKGQNPDNISNAGFSFKQSEIHLKCIFSNEPLERSLTLFYSGHHWRIFSFSEDRLVRRQNHKLQNNSRWKPLHSHYTIKESCSLSVTPNISAECCRCIRVYI